MFEFKTWKRIFFKCNSKQALFSCSYGKFFSARKLPEWNCEIVNKMHEIINS